MKRQPVKWHHLWTGTSWYREGIHALVSGWRKAVVLDGDDVEN
jgi:hypothetical protein